MLGLERRETVWTLVSLLQCQHKQLHDKLIYACLNSKNMNFIGSICCCTVFSTHEKRIAEMLCQYGNVFLYVFGDPQTLRRQLTTTHLSVLNH